MQSMDRSELELKLKLDELYRGQIISFLGEIDTEPEKFRLLLAYNDRDAIIDTIDEIHKMVYRLIPGEVKSADCYRERLWTIELSQRKWIPKIGSVRPEPLKGWLLIKGNNTPVSIDCRDSWTAQLSLSRILITEKAKQYEQESARSLENTKNQLTNTNADGSVVLRVTRQLGDPSVVYICAKSFDHLAKQFDSSIYTNKPELPPKMNVLVDVDGKGNSLEFVALRSYDKRMEICFSTLVDMFELPLQVTVRVNKTSATSNNTVHPPRHSNVHSTPKQKLGKPPIDDKDDIDRKHAFTSIPPTSIPPSSIPPTSIPPCSIPPSSIPPCSIPPSSIPPTSIPPTSIPPTSIPPTSIAPTSIPPTSIPHAPITAAPITAAPITAAPTTAAPTTAAPTTAAPTTAPTIASTNAVSNAVSNASTTTAPLITSASSFAPITSASSPAPSFSSIFRPLLVLFRKVFESSNSFHPIKQTLEKICLGVENPFFKLLFPIILDSIEKQDFNFVKRTFLSIAKVVEPDLELMESLLDVLKSL